MAEINSFRSNCGQKNFRNFRWRESGGKMLDFAPKMQKIKPKTVRFRLYLVRVFITDLQKDGQAYSFRAFFACDISEKKKFERKQIMKITYTENKNGIYYPKLTLPASSTHSIGKYGRGYLEYLKKYRRGTYTTLLTENRLNEYLHQVDIEAREMVLKITEEIAVSHGILRRRAKAHGAGRGSTKMHANFPSAGKCARSPSPIDKKARMSFVGRQKCTQILRYVKRIPLDSPYPLCYTNSNKG